MAKLKLIAELGLDKTGFDAGMAAAGKTARKFDNDLKSALAGAFAASAIVAFTRHIIEAVSKVNDLSERLNVSAEALQAMDYAAKQSGTSLETVAGAFRALSKARLEAMKDPNSAAGQVFAGMGIGNAELKATNLEGIFRRIASTIQSTDFGASELAMVEALLGRSGGELIPMFKAGLEQSTEEAKRLGLVMDEDVVQKIDDVGDSLDRMATKLKATVAPAIGFVADKFRDMLDLGEILVGNVGAIIGTKLGGGSWQEAREAGRQHVFDVLARREGEQAAQQEKADRRRAGLPANPEAERVAKEFEFKATEKPAPAMREAAARGGFNVTETAFGRIGAFTGAAAGAAVPQLLQQQINHLNAMRDALVTRGITVRDVR